MIDGGFSTIRSLYEEDPSPLQAISNLPERSFVGEPEGKWRINESISWEKKVTLLLGRKPHPSRMCVGVSRPNSERQNLTDSIEKQLSGQEK